MSRGFFGMQGASVLGCGNDWIGPATTSPIADLFKNIGFSPAPTRPRVDDLLEPMTEEIQLGKALSCTLCEAKKKAIAQARRDRGILEGRLQLVNGSRRPYMGGRPADTTEGTLGCPACGLDGARIEQQARQRMGQICAISPVSSAGMSCQKTSTGDVICSNNIVYAADCPNSPAVNYPGVAVNVAGVPTPPPAPGAAGVAPLPGAVPADTGVSPILIGAGALAALGLVFLAFK
jgi:hypothetical protein